MVTGFENITYAMSPMEREHILPFIVDIWLQKSVNKKVYMCNMIKAANKHCVDNNILRTKGKGKGKPYTIDEPRMRQVIHHIRKYDLVPRLVATSNGYYKADNDEDVKKFIQSCRERANSFLEIANAMEHHYDLGTPKLRRNEQVSVSEQA